MNAKAFLALVLLFLAGCATTPADRIARNHAAYASWPPDVQAMVRAGQISLGFDPGQVSVALGNPDRAFTRTTVQGTEEVWVYRSHRPRITVGVGVMGGGGSTRVGGATEVSTGGPYSGDALRVIFTAGRVSAVEKMTQ